MQRVRAAREAADSSGVPIVINARTDVYLLGVGEPDTRFEHAIRRANAYRKAGADCLFIPAVTRRADIERIVPALEGPLNLLAFPGIPTVPELERLGVARLSVGTRLTLGAMSVLKKTVAELLSTGTYESMLEGTTTYRRRESSDGQPPKLVALAAAARNRIFLLTYIHVRAIAANKGGAQCLKEFLWFRSSLAVSFP